MTSKQIFTSCLVPSISRVPRCLWKIGPVLGPSSHSHNSSKHHHARIPIDQQYHRVQHRLLQQIADQTQFSSVFRAHASGPNPTTTSRSSKATASGFEWTLMCTTKISKLTCLPLTNGNPQLLITCWGLAGMYHIYNVRDPTELTGLSLICYSCSRDTSPANPSSNSCQQVSACADFITWSTWRQVAPLSSNGPIQLTV